MEAEHRGYRIEVVREECMAGHDLLYYWITRIADGYEPLCDYEDSGETVRDKVKQLRDLIDAELAEDDPWMERAEAGRL